MTKMVVFAQGSDTTANMGTVRHRFESNNHMYEAILMIENEAIIPLKNDEK